MANDEHVAILKKGVDTWNKWRKADQVEGSLTDADLSGADLSRASLSEANLGGANLSVLCAKHLFVFTSATGVFR